MSAQSLQISTLVIPDPGSEPVGASDNAKQVNNATLAYDYLTSFDIRTLSTVGASGSSDVRGLLYTPDLPPTDSCNNQSAAYIPQNVTRIADLPKSYDLVALVPWVSGQCTLNYMQAARRDPCKGFLVFIPGNSTSTPPGADAPIWDFGSDDWQGENGFPVYAIPADSGSTLLMHSALYSGNMTEVPHGEELAQSSGDSNAYVRLLADIDTGGSGQSLPSLWVFLLVVLGILLAIIGLTSLSMHWLQRRRRQSLRRRVARGEVDLEALGIKRLTVPQDVLDKMPLYTYGTGQPVSQSSRKDPTIAEEKLEDVSVSTRTAARPAPALLRATSYRPTPLSQPTCAICLDDFVAASAETPGTTVRELPCHHIFHPECVDTFLRDSSSLCPMCKKTALPVGYCPRAITNAMVRRERMVRQLRERVVVEPVARSRQLNPEDYVSPLERMRTRYTQLRTSRRISSAPVTSGQQMQELTPPSDAAVDTARPPLARSSSTSASGISPATPQIQPPSTPSRREWARQRAVNMLGQQAPTDPETEEARQTPGWRKAVRGLFPGFHR